MQDVLDVEEVMVDHVEIDGEYAELHESWLDWLDDWMVEWITDKQMDTIYESYERSLD